MGKYRVIERNKNENSDPADHLQEAKVDIISNCADIAGEDYGDIDEEKQICAGKSDWDEGFHRPDGYNKYALHLLPNQ